MDKLLQKISRDSSLSKDLIADIEQHFKLERIKKNHRLLEEHKYCRKLFFLKSGTIRTFYFAKEKDITSWFYMEGQFFTAWSSFYSQQASFEYIEAVEDCEIYSIDYFTYNQLLDKHRQFERFGRLLAQDFTVIIDQFSKGYMFLSAKEKYDLLQAYFPDITQRVNLGHIASFLGINQATLSRIRKAKI